MIPNDSHEKLLRSFHDAEMTEEQAAQLLALWEQDPNLLAQAGQVHFVDRLLHEMAAQKENLSSRRKKQLQNALAARFPDLVTKKPTFPVSAPVTKNPPSNLEEPIAWTEEQDDESEFLASTPSRFSRQRNHAELGTALYPLLVILLFVLLFFPVAIYLEFYATAKNVEEQPAHKFAAVASISGITEHKTAQNTPIAKLGRRFQEGDRLHLEEGTVEFLFNNNVRMILQGPGRVQLISAMNVFCEEGRLSVTVPPEGKGFEIASPKLTVRDLGTQFLMDVSDENAEVHVIKGLVEANGLSRDWIPLNQGLGIRTVGGNMSRIAADRSLFVFPEMMQQWTSQFLEKQKKQHAEEVAAKESDPRTLLFLDFEPEKQTADRHATARSAYRIRGARAVRGQWSLWGAMEFKKPKQVIRASVKNVPKSFTLSSTIKINWTNQYTNMIFVWRGTKDGKIVWKINRYGALQLVIDEGGGKQPVSYDSSMAVGPHLYDVWLNLTTMVDYENKKVRHYLDGQKISEHRLENDLNMTLEDIELGNWTQKGNVTASYLNGAMDDFLLYDGLIDEASLRHD